uniref:Uncharacterized protein n=1 Tax=Amphimedon queenslandica TaxID=400682 RepID=A0A1X7T255_AMPQE
MATGSESENSIKYSGLLLYEEKGINDYLVSFMVAKNTGALFEYIEKNCPDAEIGQTVYFKIAQKDSTLISRGDFIDLKFDTPQDNPTTGWIIVPHIRPCRIYRDAVESNWYLDIPPTRIISVFDLPNAVPTLHYTIPVEGVVEPVTLIIDTSLIKGLHHYREALKTTVTCELTKAVVQGEARVGKTAFKSLLLDETYVKASTSIAEPRVGIHRYRKHESCDTGKRYQRLKVTELEEIVKNALKKGAIKKLASSPVVDQAGDGITSKGKESPHVRNIGNETTDKADARSVDKYANGPRDVEGVSKYEMGMSKTVVNKVLKGVKQCSGEEENHLEGARWLYLIDTGGQIAFQKLLPIFMPFAQALILVVNLSKDLSSQSTSVMHIERKDLGDGKDLGDDKDLGDGKDLGDDSPYSLPVEEVLKQIISSIASGMQHFRDRYQEDEALRNLVPEKLKIFPIGTYGDECSNPAQSKHALAKKLAEIINANDDCEAFGDNRLVEVHEIDGRIANTAVEERESYADYEDTKSTLNKVHEFLEKNKKEIKIPFFYYFFDILLRVVTKDGCGVLKLSKCISLGKELNLERNDVLESLKFLHQINSIIYYDKPEVSDYKTLVFVDIGSLIGILKKLVQRVFQDHSNKEIYIGDKDGIIKGMLSESEFEEICKDQLNAITKELEITNKIIATKLLKLFVELSIATPIDDKYFIPALLPVIDVTDINPYNDREPLLFYFKKATPMGLFCSVVTRLLSRSCYEIVSTKIDNFSNYIKMNHRKSSYRVVLVEQVNCIEVHCENESIECSARKDVREAITSAAEKHNLSESHRNPEIRFYCSCERGPAEGGVAKGEKHTVTVNEERCVFRCTKTEKICDNKITWKSWLRTGTPNTRPSNDESTSPATKQSTPQGSASETGSTVGSLQEAK